MKKSNCEHVGNHKLLNYPLLLLFLFALLFALSACDSHEHTGGERCLSAAVCEICGEEYGEPAGHAFDYVRDKDGHTKKCTREGCDEPESRSAHSGGVSTCTAGGVCEICGYEYLKKTNHNFLGTTCAELGTCSSCGAADTEYKDHRFSGATCVKLGTCTVCGAEGGDYKTHTYRGATCTKLGTCATCGQEGGKLLDHRYEGATCSQLAKCTSCGQEGGEYSDVHDLPEGADACTLCGLDYYSASLQFRLNSTKDGYIVTGIGSCTRTKLVIPATYKGLPVTEIGNSAFSGWGNGVLQDITEVELPTSLVRIGNSAFECFTALKSIRIPEGVTHIGANAFYYCELLSEITLPESLTTISEGAFASCGFTKIVIPKNVTTIGAGAFALCKQLTHLELHDGITSLDTTELVTSCVALERIRLPKSVTVIGEFFAAGCDALTTVEFGGEIISIGASAFSGCGKLVSINLGTKLESIQASAFAKCTSLASIRIPDTLKQLEMYAFSGCTALTEIVIPSKISVLAVGVFSGCTGLETVTLPDTVTQIGSKTFFNCSALRNINLSSSLESVGENAFGGCTSLACNTYQGMGYLGNAENPYLIWVSRTDASVKDVVLHKDTKFIMGGVLTGLDITSLTIGEYITYISTSELVRHTTLAKIDVAAGNKTYHTSGNCLIETATKTLIKGFPNSVIPGDGSVKIIGLLAFANLADLTTMVIPDTVEELSDQVFRNCANLESIVIGVGVKKIGGSLLYECKKLQAIYFNGTADQWEAIDIVGEVQTGTFTIDNGELLDTTKYFYSEEKPTTKGHYWHYVDGKPQQW